MREFVEFVEFVFFPVRFPLEPLPPLKKNRSLPSPADADPRVGKAYTGLQIERKYGDGDPITIEEGCVEL